MPELGKATYVLQIDSKAYSAQLANAERQARISTSAIAKDYERLAVAGKNAAATSSTSWKSVGSSQNAAASATSAAAGRMTTANEEVATSSRGMATAVKSAMASAMGSIAAAETRIAAAGAKIRAVGGKMTSTGRGIMRGFTTPVAAIGIAAGVMAVKFEESMLKIQNLVGVSSKQVKTWSGQLLKLGPALGKSPKELADALFFITSAGIKGNAAIKLLTASAKASAIGLGDTKTVADAVSSAINAYGKSNLTATQGVNVLAAAVKEGKTDAASVGPVLGNLLPVAAKVGVSFNQVGAGIASMTRTGSSARNAATALRAIMITSLKPTKQTEQALKGVGLSADGLRQSLKEKGLLATLQVLAARTHGNGTAMAKLFPNIRALVGAFSLTGKNAKATAGIFKDMGGKIDIVNPAFKRLSETAGFKAKQAIHQLESSMIQLGAVLLPIVVPAIAKVAEVIGKVISAFGKLPTPVKQVIIALVAIVAVLGPLLIFFGAVTSAIATLTLAFGLSDVALTPWILAIVAVIAVGVLLVANWKTIKAALITVWHAIVDAAKTAWGVLKSVFLNFTWLGQIIQHWSAIKAALAAVWHAIEAAARAVWNGLKTIFLNFTPLGQLIQHWQQVKSVLSGVFNAIKSAAATAFGAIAGIIRSVVGAVKSAASAVGGAIKDGISAGIQGLVGLVKSIVNIVIGVINAFIGEFNSVAGPHHLGISILGHHIGATTPGAHINPIQPLARGGTVNSDTQLVGERGPELVHLPRGSRVTKASETSTQLQRVKREMHMIWQTARNFYPGAAGHGMPKTLFTHGSDALFLGDAYSPSKSGKRGGGQFLIWPDWFVNALDPIEMKKRGVPWASVGMESLIHEWAHYFQDKRKTGSAWRSEGGADAFAREFAPQIYARAGIPYKKNTVMSLYDPFVTRVKSQLGENWIKEGQFSKPADFLGKKKPIAAKSSVTPKKDNTIGTDIGVKSSGGRGAPLIHAGMSAMGAIRAMIAKANAINAAGYNYEWGGGHNGSFAPTHGTGHGSGPGIGYDCSGAVSAVLHAGGVLSSPLNSSGLEGYGAGGPGDVTIWANAGHTWMKILGHAFGTSGNNPGGGARWYGGNGTAGFAVRHAPVSAGSGAGGVGNLFSGAGGGKHKRKKFKPVPKLKFPDIPSLPKTPMLPHAFDGLNGQLAELQKRYDNLGASFEFDSDLPIADQVGHVDQLLGFQNTRIGPQILEMKGMAGAAVRQLRESIKAVHKVIAAIRREIHKEHEKIKAMRARLTHIGAGTQLAHDLKGEIKQRQKRIGTLQDFIKNQANPRLKEWGAQRVEMSDDLTKFTGTVSIPQLMFDMSQTINELNHHRKELTDAPPPSDNSGSGSGSSLPSVPQTVVDFNQAAAGLALGVPGLARGGVLTRPTLFVGGEGGESEIVSPESMLREIMQEEGHGGDFIQNNHMLVPNDPRVLDQIGRAATAGHSFQGGRPASRRRSGL